MTPHVHCENWQLDTQFGKIISWKNSEIQMETRMWFRVVFELQSTHECKRAYKLCMQLIASLHVWTFAMTCNGQTQHQSGWLRNVCLYHIKVKIILHAQYFDRTVLIQVHFELARGQKRIWNLFFKFCIWYFYYSSKPCIDLVVTLQSLFG